MNEEQDIDKIFRQKLGEPVDQPAYREDDWNALEQLLDGGKKRRGMVYWLPVLSGVAAMLLLVLGWWLFKPQATGDAQKPKNQIAKVIQLKKQQPANTDELTAKNDAKEPIANVPPTDVNSIITAQQPVQQPQLTNFKLPNIVNSGTPTVQPSIVITGQSTSLVDNVSPELAVINSGVKINTAAHNGNVLAKNIITNDYAKSLAIERNKATITSNLKRPQFALTIMGAPDINGVNSFQQTKTGTNVGLLFSIGVNKLTLTTGVAYSYKPYNTAFNGYQNTGSTYSSGYYSFRANPINVLADCRMLDIPLNIDYQLFNKNQNKLSIGTGLSSYIMLKESYTYEYSDPTTRLPSGYSVASPGKYLFGVMNLQATYTRQVNAKVGISVQPYFKLPLGEVGASQVKLQSAGIAIGLSWNINSLTKP